VTDESDLGARRWARFFEIFESVPRGGPGDLDSTRRALSMMTSLPVHPRVLDLGCGPGAGSSTLARLTGGRVTALDLHLPFVAQQASAARAAGLSHRLDPACADMRAAPFVPGVFDLVWSEGALYSVGFRNGLEVCLRLAKPGAYIAVSEAVWTVPDPPAEVLRWWTGQYADIAHVAEKIALVSSLGVDIVGHFTLSSTAWRDQLYGPIKASLDRFRQAWAADAVGVEVIAEFETEIEMFERWGHAYSYEFFVGRRPPG
jgi:SAM-dependent methyltransferase